MSTFDLIINIFESLGYLGFIYYIFHIKKGLSILIIFVLLKTTITSIHNYFLLPELSLSICSQLMIFLYAYLINRSNIVQNVFLTFLIYNIDSFSITVSMMITDIFFLFPFYQGNSYYSLAILTRILFMIIAYLAYHIIKKSAITFTKTNKIISILSILFILELLYSSCIELIFYNNIFDIYIKLILFFINILVVILFYTFFESQREQNILFELQEKNIRNENQIKINQINEESIKHLAIWKHDITYVFTYLENHIKRQNYNSALKTISLYRDILNNYNLFKNTNNDTLNSLLIEYIEQITLNNIYLYINTDQSEVLLSFQDYQKILYLFFNHAIQNCQSDYQKSIWISYYTQSPYFTLSLEYTCITPSLEVLYDDINNIISQYEGFMKISNQDGKDILKIIIPT